jgi:hypothetical protein
MAIEIRDVSPGVRWRLAGLGQRKSPDAFSPRWKLAFEFRYGVVTTLDASVARAWFPI